MNEGASPLQLWLGGARPQTLVLSLTPIAVGAAYAHAAFHRLALVPLAAATLSAIAIQVATNLANDSADGGRGADGGERLGPTRLVGAGLMSASLASGTRWWATRTRLTAIATKEHAKMRKNRSLVVSQ